MVKDIRIRNGWQPIEVWFQDEARISQKNKITRPREPHDQRAKWAYIFGAICPVEGTGAGLNHALGRHPRDGRAPEADQRRSGPRRARHPDHRPGRVAHFAVTQRA